MTGIEGREPAPGGPPSGGVRIPLPVASGYQGAVFMTESADGPVVIKRPLGRGIPRAVRRAMLRHEHAIYQRLAGVPGIPRCLGFHGGEELVLEFIEGTSLRQLKGEPPQRERFFADLLDVIKAMHAAGVAHGDLKRKNNILLGADGRPYLIDFGTAVSAPAGSGILRRFVFRQLQRIDFNAWIKLKYRRRWAEIEPADLEYYRPTLIERLARVIRRAWRSVTFRRRRKARRTNR